MSQSSFADLGVSRAVVDALARGGINDPFPVQRLVIGEVLAGRDVLVRSPTGSGKTLAFAVPMVERIAAEAARPAALILAPTRELVVQIAEELYPIAHAASAEDRARVRRRRPARASRRSRPARTSSSPLPGASRT